MLPRTDARPARDRYACGIEVDKATARLLGARARLVGLPFRLLQVGKSLLGSGGRFSINTSQQGPALQRTGRSRHAREFQIFRTEVLHFLKPCDLIAERTFPVFVDFLNITDTRSVSSGFGSSDAQTRGSDRNGMCFI
jgi:hypothetical protein